MLDLRRCLRAVIAVLSVCATACGPSAEGSVPSPAGAPASAEAAPPSTERPSPIRFVAEYPATLLYALDGAAGQRNRDPGYRTWLVGEEAPDWLDAYAGRRRAWGAKTVADDAGGAAAFDACGWETTSVEELIACLEGVVPAADRPLLRRALTEADRRLSPKWPEIEARLAGLVPEIEAGLASERARDLIATLRHEASLPEEAPLRFDVVLVGKPPGEHTYARQVGHYLVHEVGPNETAGSLLGTAFHELAHLAHAISPARRALDEAFLGLGETGLLAANAWEEIVATAFGQGLAAEALDPSFDVERSMYADAMIDTLGRTLYRQWKSGRDVVVGAELASRLTELVDEAWSRGERSIGRHLWSVVVTANDQAALEHALDGVSYRGAHRSRPIDDSMRASPELPPWAVRVALVTEDELAVRPALTERMAMAAASWDPALVGHEAAAFRRTDPDGALLFVVVAKDVEALREATPRFARLARMVPDGWTAF